MLSHTHTHAHTHMHTDSINSYTWSLSNSDMHKDIHSHHTLFHTMLSHAYMHEHVRKHTHHSYSHHCSSNRHQPVLTEPGERSAGYLFLRLERSQSKEPGLCLSLTRCSKYYQFSQNSREIPTTTTKFIYTPSVLQLQPCFQRMLGGDSSEVGGSNEPSTGLWRVTLNVQPTMDTHVSIGHQLPQEGVLLHLSPSVPH